MKNMLIGTVAAVVSFAGLALLSLQFFLALPQVFELLSLSEPLAVAAIALAGRIVPRAPGQERRGSCRLVPWHA